MRVILEDFDQLITLKLPKDIGGNFWINDKKKNNLVNIVAQNNKWIIKSNAVVKIIKNAEEIKNEILTNVNQVESIELIEYNTYYLYNVLKGEMKKIYCLPTSDETITQLMVDYANVNEITIGSGDKDLISIKNGQLAKNQLTLHFFNGILKISNNNLDLKMFINDIVEKEKQIFSGDSIFIAGVTIFVVGNLILINNPNNTLSYDTIKLTKRSLPLNPEKEFSKEENFIEYFNQNQYFQRPPRFKRMIEKKVYKIDPPPASPINKDEMPLIYTMGPMMLMGMSSLTYGLSAITNVISGKSTFAENSSQIIMTITMLGGTLIFPFLQKMYVKANNAKKERKRKKKYKKYIDEKKEEILQEIEMQRQILIENNYPLETVANVILSRNRTLWDRKLEHNDFLDVRLGIGNVQPVIDINFPEEHFSMDEDNLKDVYESLFDCLKTIDNVPVTVNMLKNTFTGIIGEYNFLRIFMDGIMLQLLAYHSYDILKVVVITSNEKKHTWQKYRNIPHFWNNEKTIRFIGVDSDDINKISNEMIFILNERLESLNEEKEVEKNKDVYKKFKEHYLIISDEMNLLKSTSIYNELMKQKVNIGMSMLFITDSVDMLPNECNHFVNVNAESGGVFETELVSDKQKLFVPDIPSFNMQKCYVELCNIPIDIAAGKFELPKTYSFLEMYDVGNVNQLNIANRWKNNNIIKSLSAPVGINEQGDLFKIDLHEKAHGPHGLVAGMTGSGKSEWIITYILSMAVNYHPDEVQFVLIDYKGGGLAGTFENKETGVKLPHLAGTITNLDISEINRSLASINSELKRRQALFNQARDKLGESSVDIYKYQKWYREKKIDTPISHLFIISDEFAELKSQQPDFMQELISTARIGRSLGVHLILATQKPSGVVDDQIWSNSKFRVCLKVQDKSDSNDMIRCPDAALLKETGRFFLQVGYNEFFAKGQSAWAGAPYYESDTHKKTIDTDLYFLDGTGQVYKEINSEKKFSNAILKGEELPNILKEIISINDLAKTNVKNLWLDAIPPLIYTNDLLQKYEYKKENFVLNPIIGEYDAPQYQKQALLTLPLTTNGNTLIYGVAGSGKESLLTTIVYSLMITHYYQEVNVYILDFGAETLSCFKNSPIVGDVILSPDAEKVCNYFKFIEAEFLKRKKMFQDYNGDYQYYVKKTKQALPTIVTILNNYENFEELYGMQFNDLLLKLTREAEKCGIIFILTANSTNTIKYSLTQNFKQNICLKLKDDYDYKNILGSSNKIIPASHKGRGAININGEAFEFQTSHPINVEDENEYIVNLSKQMLEKQGGKAPSIKVLPEIVDYEYVKDYLNKLNDCPIGVDLNSIDICKYNFVENKVNIVAAQNIDSLVPFSKSLINLCSLNSDKVRTVVLDGIGILENLVDNSLYLNKSFKAGILKIDELLKKVNDNTRQLFIYIYGVTQMLMDRETNEVFQKFINKLTTLNNIAVVLCDSADNLFTLSSCEWYKNIFNGENGMFIGGGIANQMIFPSIQVTSEMRGEITEEFGFIIKNSKLQKFKSINIIKNSNNE